VIRIYRRIPGAAISMVFALTTLLLPGCDRQQVRAYRAPKDTVTPAAATNAATEAGPSSLHWKLPQGWQELPPSSMRVGSFAVTGPNNQKAQVAIIPLAGGAGGDFENVNRWRGQVGLPRVGQDELAKLADNVEIAGERGPLFEFAGVPLDGDKKTRLLAAILHRSGTAWFFKMTGDDEWVAAQKPTFLQFLKGVSFAGEGGERPAAPGGRRRGRRGPNTVLQAGGGRSSGGARERGLPAVCTHSEVC